MKRSSRSMNEDEAEPPVRARVSNACDTCKARKVKCDGNVPCAYCARRQRGSSCHYSPQTRRRTTVPRATATPESSVRTRTPDRLSRRDLDLSPATTTFHPGPSEREPHHRVATPASSQATTHVHTHARESLGDEETDVPREARLLRDGQGKLIFIGDCAPLSFFQSVRQLITSRVDPNAFAHQTGRFSGPDTSLSRPPAEPYTSPPALHHNTIASAVASYSAVTSGIVDLFPHPRLVDDISIWSSQAQAARLSDISSAVNYLVLSIGYQPTQESLAFAYFDYARGNALANLSGNLTIPTIQAFILITLYMLGSCQTNGAFVFFGIAVRAAYSIGIHRTEINARFGSETQHQRDRLWKSLRVLDLFLSTSMGRPPATSDVDCTVPYGAADENGVEHFDTLNASVQIFLITEEIVVEVYSRKKISYQLTEGISRRLREWAVQWLPRLRNVVAVAPADDNPGSTTGACQVMCSYFYAVILVSRPFLMFEMHKRLSGDLPRHGHPASHNDGAHSSVRSKLADACIDSASFMVEHVADLIDRGHLQGHMPLIVSWLFAASLVLGIGLLGSFGRILEKYTRKCIQSLEHFSKNDTNAAQYALIAKSLLASALGFLEKRELDERQRRTESSSQLFGLVPRDGQECGPRPVSQSPSQSQSQSQQQAAAASSGTGYLGLDTPPFGDMITGFLGLPNSLPRTPSLSSFSMEGRMDGGGDASFNDFNLFQLLDGGGHIDLGPYM
ncbi:fungal-specific transcription factor domain-containing protein [Sodiomyces alkalinus F11]|uniref:Fungal-specific transcription factor domain-containing protein n=1 Tax=Sodiomyces alkalinus (strain CBS 110278 / VKM F-3762 / F11) TaxID=1314773 RepID=A0A3N2Q7X3_SODAK|nr:fungal-specific transcription factor domain-containing protein [Sodiomyces alkalinus F11]ROT42874.1 fungal-specific transcription factor domain-containing protein [Sodiomyces alkalinus F11]